MPPLIRWRPGIALMRLRADLRVVITGEHRHSPLPITPVERASNSELQVMESTYDVSRRVHLPQCFIQGDSRGRG
jgi:hypothetical protein